MLRNEAVELVKQGLGFRTGTSIDVNIINSMKHVQWTLEHAPVLPWFLTGEILSISTVPSEQRVLVPEGFLREVDEGAMWRFNGTETPGTWTELIKEDFDFLQAKQQGSGAPRWYTLLGNYFRLFPLPDAAYPLKVICYLSDVVLDTNIENKWLKYAQDLVIANTGRLLAASLVNKSAEVRFEKDSATALVRLVHENEARIHINRKYVVGGRG